MKYCKVRILVHQPVIKRLFEDFFIERLNQEGIDVLFYDLTSIFHKGLEINGEYASPLILKFGQIIDFEKQIIKDDVENTLYIPYFIYEFKVLKVYRILSKYNCHLAFMGRGMLPHPHIDENLFNTLLRKFSSLFNLQFLRSGFGKLYATYLKKQGHIKKFDIIFNAGYMGHHTCGTSFESNSASLIPFNSTDYTRYLKSLDSDFSISETRYAVFLDEYLPFHPDFEMLKMKTVKPESYFRELNDFFSHLESALNISVVIAAHPKSDYKVNPFDGRQIIKNETENLIKDSAIVIDHFSTAISYAILNKKPLLLIYTEEMKEVFPNLIRYADHVATILDVEIVNITKENRDSYSLNVNEHKYEEYKYNYLTMPEAEFKTDEDIFVEFLKTS